MMHVARQSDEQIMASVAEGDDGDLSVLVRRYANSLLTFVCRMIGDHARGEEVFQEVFLAVWRQRATFDPTKSFRAWLFGIAANQCRVVLRKRQPTEQLDDVPTSALASLDMSPDDATVAMESADLVVSAMQQLPEKQRAVVVLRIWNGFSYAEIADVVGAKESTVRSRMFHGLNEMRRYLEPRM